MIRIVDKYPYPVEVTEHIWITMPDGYRLSAFEGEDEADELILICTVDEEEFGDKEEHACEG